MVIVPNIGSNISPSTSIGKAISTVTGAVIPGIAPLTNTVNLSTTIANQFFLQQKEKELILRAILEDQLRKQNKPLDKEQKKSETTKEQIEAAKVKLKNSDLKVSGSNSGIGGRDEAINALAKAFGGNKDLIDKIANSGLSIELTDGAAGMKTRFGQEAGAYYDSGSHSVKVAAGSDIGTLIHEVGHSLDRDLDGRFGEGNSGGKAADAASDAIANIAQKVKESGDYSLAGNSNELHYGFSDNDKAEQLAEATRIAYEHPEEFKKRFGKDAETIIDYLKKDAWGSKGGNKELTTANSQNAANFLAMKNIMDMSNIMNLMNAQKSLMPMMPNLMTFPNYFTQLTSLGTPSSNMFGLSIT